MALMARLHEADPDLPVVMITGFASIESAVATVREGAFDYLPKSFSVDQLRVAVERALRHRGLQVENRNLRKQLQQALGFENVVGRSPAMAQVFELVKKAARSEANILVLGESGSGKELIARAIHANSPRAAGPFVPVDCASLPEQLLESELFGHEKGAFTGAVRTKTGLVETAHRGTLFLDEIGDLPAPLQVKLLPRAPGAADPAGRGHRAGGRGCPSGVGDEPQPDRSDRQGAVPGRTLLPHQRHRDPTPGAP
jgi:DNA-binding NtrC family response regulator